MNKKFVKSVIAGVLTLGIATSCSMLHKDHNKCNSEKCHNGKCKKSSEANKCSSAKTESNKGSVVKAKK